MARIEILAALVVAALGLSCARVAETTPPPPRGHLLILGGAMDDDNPVWSRLAELAGSAGVAVLPTASGVPEESGPNTAALIASHEGVARTVMITEGSPELAEDAEAAAEIAASGGVFFTGGDQNRVTATLLRPDGTRTPALEAVWQVLDRGGVVAGTSAGAALMSDPMITGGSSEGALLHGVDASGEDGVGAGRGLGFLGWGLTDQHHIRRGRTGRLLVALRILGHPLGFGVDENSALEVDRATATGTVVSGTVLVADVREMTGEVGAGFQNARLSLLRPGDRVDLPSGEVTPAGAPVEPVDSARAQRHLVRDVWGRRGFPELACALGPGLQRLSAADVSAEVVLSADGETRFYSSPGAAELTVVRARLDIALLPDTSQETAP